MSLANKKGVDISYANGNIDLARVKSAGYAGVMIRCGFGSDIASQDDSQFVSNVNKAEKLGLPWGVYLYSYATNQSEAKSEVAHIVRLLKGRKPTLPVALDVEDSAYYSKYGCYNKASLTSIVGTILSGIKEAGYYPALYTGKYWLDTYIDKSVYNKYDIWIAAWLKQCNYSGSNLGIWQYGGETNLIESNSITGVGVIDKDLFYKDYPTIIKAGGYNNWAKSSSTSSTSSSSTSTTQTTAITEAQLRQKVANTANYYIGADEGSAKYQEIIKIYNAQKPLPVGYAMTYNDAWCAAFVSAIWLKVGIAEYTGTECGCGRFIDVAKKLGIWTESDSYVPKIGDAIIYDWSDNGVGENTDGADHVGLVTKTSSKGFTVTEGNMGSGYVGVRDMNVNGRYIRGFITPDYAAIAKKVAGKITPDNTVSTPVATTSSNTKSNIGVSAVKEIQTWLNSNYKTGLAVDGAYGAKTKAALIKALQTELNKQFNAGLAIDGIFGNKTASACVNLSMGDQGNLTKTLQGLLICNGYSTNGFDGVFGNGTRNAVISYQRAKGLSADGIAGRNTFTKLCA